MPSPPMVNIIPPVRPHVLCVDTTATQSTWGSGLQCKFGMVAVARQDTSHSIPDRDSASFLQRVETIAADVSSGSAVHDLAIQDTGLDIEITTVKQASPPDSPRADDTAQPSSQLTTGRWTKGKGVTFLDEELNLRIAEGPNLVCGDTVSDIPMVEAVMAVCPQNTYSLFVTTDEELKKRVLALNELAKHPVAC
eukprot:NODE_523_length_897_cov_741.653302_g399_i0.p1 GENE.NODE_523_length_897_cov_741.653302_g399_i0~~NODE_523_length_897_cov_741.653302_g399_i0.p1  ORF type:complete len:194 (-),score=52.16 NODE_523_length_897_cov_741.653302_g399_i0:102-683(-)